MARGTFAGRVLIVDDNHDARETLADLIEAYGYATAAVKHGLEALDTLRHNPPPPDLILLSGEEPHEGHSIDLDPVRWLRKPVDLASVLDLIGRCCSA